MLGENFERLHGDQVSFVQPLGNTLFSGGLYQLPAETCTRMDRVSDGTHKLFPVGQARQVAWRFMEARVKGKGAEKYLSPHAHDLYKTHASQQLHLYRTKGGDCKTCLRYERFQVLSVEEPGEGHSEVRVAIEGTYRGVQSFRFEEVLLIGPGINGRGQFHQHLVIGASGGEGP